MTTTARRAVALVLRRTIDAAPERVFDAWTDPEMMQRFLSPAETVCRSVEVDARVGGAFRIEMVRDDGDTYVAFGNYLEFDRPHRLVSTWMWEEDDVADQHETRLTLEFTPCGAAQTELILTHENFRDAQQRDNHNDGWTQILDAMVRLAREGGVQ